MANTAEKTMTVKAVVDLYKGIDDLFAIKPKLSFEVTLALSKSKKALEVEFQAAVLAETSAVDIYKVNKTEELEGADELLKTALDGLYLSEVKVELYTVTEEQLKGLFADGAIQVSPGITTIISHLLV